MERSSTKRQNCIAMENTIANRLPDLSLAVELPELDDAHEKRERWLQQRLGKFTAPEFHRLMTYEKSPTKFPDGAET